MRWLYTAHRGKKFPGIGQELASRALCLHKVRISYKDLRQKTPTCLTKFLTRILRCETVFLGRSYHEHNGVYQQKQT